MAEQTQSPPKHHKSDGNAGFLRAARDGNLDDVLEYLKGSTDINTSNPNGLNALHLASKEGHLSIVTELITRGANVEAATKKGNTALHIASLAGHEDIVRKLVESGAQVNLQAQAGFTPLYMASQEGHSEVVKFLLASGANQGLSTEDGFTPLAVALQQGHDKVVSVLLEHDAKGKVRLPALHIAAKKNDVKSAALLLQNEQNSVELQTKGGLVNDTTKSGFTPLHIAAHYGNTDVATLLITRNADVNFKAKNNITPLHVCSRWGKLNMVNLLLDNNATIDEKTRDGLTPLHCAARSGHESVVDTLLERGAPHSAKTKNGLTPLHMSAQGDHEDCARLLLYHKASLNEVTVDYLTPLHVAAHCGNIKTAKLLLDRKCEPNARALNGFTPLHIACKKNRIKVVELLLKYGASIESKTESGLTPLHVASFMGHMNIVIYLIQHNANPNTATVRGETSLHLAARANQSDIIRILLRNGATVDARAREQQTPLHIAARLGNVDNVVLLLQHGAAVDAATKDKYTPLHIAAKEGHDEVAQILLEHEAQHDMTTKKGFTPLHIAAKYGNIKVARLLLQKDANPNAQGKNGLTPLHVATHYNHPSVAQLLLENKADPHAVAKNGYTPLHIAAKKNQMDIATMLLEYGAKPNAESKNGFTPLHLASQEGHTDIVSLLLEKKANVNSKAQNGLTPIHLAAQEDRVAVAEILCKYGSETDTHTKAGYTPLHTACHFGQVNMVRFLLDHQASVNATTKVGYTPLHQAAQQGHVQVVSTLLKNQASPNAITNNGQTPLAIAQKLGYISVVEILKPVTEVQVITPSSEDKYKVVSPETMQETFISDSEDEGVDDLLPQSPIFGKPISEQHVYLPYYEGQKMHNRKSAGEDSISLERGGSTSPMDTSFDKDYMDAQITSQSFHAVYSAAPTSAGRLPIGTDANRFSSYSGSSFSTSFDPDNVPVDRSPVYSGKLKWKSFLISFMVDARGGAMRGCRHPGVRVIIPPRKCCMPTRVTCRLVTKEKLSKPPALLEGEGLAARIIETGPVGTKFLGPVLLEVPHFASLRGKEREVVILRSDNGETWYEHPMQATEDAVAEALGSNAEELDSEDDLSKKRIKRILTNDLPMFFALVSRVTRVKQESTVIGMEGGVLSSNVVPQVQAVLPEGTLTRPIPVGLQAQPIAPELVAKLLGNRVAVSPIVTIEPRRRKFHKPITLTIPVPRAAQKGMINQYSNERPTLRLLFSLAADPNPAVWEDVTDTKPMTLVDDCVSFTTTVSARFWLIDCQNIAEAAQMASILYQEAVTVPYMAKFVVFAKRDSPEEGKLRIFCMTDDKDDKTLEKQEKFYEVARSRDIEVLEGRPQFVEMAGNLIPVTKSGDQLHVNFRAFKENRLPCTVKIRDQDQEASARVAFMKEPKVARGEAPQTPICNLNIRLPDIVLSDSGELDADRAAEIRSRHDLLRGQKLVIQDPVNKAEMRLSDVADTVQGDWVVLAQQLQVSISDINHIKNDYKTVGDQALAMLHFWVQKNGDKTTGVQLENALRRINRDDVVRKCLHNVDRVDDEVEAAAVRAAMDQSGFDTFKEEVGITKDSLKRGMSLDVQYDEQDIIKESESAAEESPTAVKGHQQFELRDEASWEHKDSNGKPSVEEEDIVRSTKISAEETLPSTRDEYSSHYYQQEQVPDRHHVTFSDEPYQVEPTRDTFEEYEEEEVLTPPPSPTEKFETEEPVLATESSIAEAATRLAKETDDYGQSGVGDGSYQHGQPKLEREVMYSRAEIVSSEVTSSYHGAQVTSESSNQVLSPLSDAGYSYHDEPSPVPEPQMPEDFKVDEFDYDRTEDDGDDDDTLQGTMKTSTGFGGDIFQFNNSIYDSESSSIATKKSTGNGLSHIGVEYDAYGDEFVHQEVKDNEKINFNNTQHVKDDYDFEEGNEEIYSDVDKKDEQKYQESNGHPADGDYERIVQTEQSHFQVTSNLTTGSIVEELVRDKSPLFGTDVDSQATKGATYEDRQLDIDRFEVKKQEIQFSESVREQLALAQTSELEEDLLIQEDSQRQLYTASIHDDSMGLSTEEEVEVIDFTEAREVALVKEEHEIYEVPYQKEVVDISYKEKKLAVDLIKEETGVETSLEDNIQKHSVTSVVTKVDEFIEKEEYVEELMAEPIEDVAAQKEFTSADYGLVHAIETEERKYIHSVESLSHSQFEETVEEEEYYDKYDERQKEREFEKDILEEDEIEDTYGVESPITDLKYTSLADPSTAELVREKIETIEEVVSKMERKFEITSNEAYEKSFTSESYERSLSDKITHEESERVKEEYRSEFTEDASETTQDFSDIKSELVESLESQHELDISKEQISDGEETITMATRNQTQDTHYLSDSKETEEHYFGEESEITESYDKTLDVHTQDQDVVSHTLGDVMEDTQFVTKDTQEPVLTYQTSVLESVQSYDDNEELKDAAITGLESRAGHEQVYVVPGHDTAHIISTEIEGEYDEEMDGTESGEMTASLERYEEMTSSLEKYMTETNDDDVLQKDEDVLFTHLQSDKVKRTKELTEVKGQGVEYASVDFYKDDSLGDKMMEAPYDEELESVTATAGSDIAGVEEVDQECFYEVKENVDKVFTADEYENQQELNGYADSDDQYYKETEEITYKEKFIDDMNELSYRPQERKKHKDENKMDEHYEEDIADEDKAEEDIEKDGICEGISELKETVEDIITEVKVSKIEAKVATLPEEEADEIEETIGKSKVKITFTQVSNDYDEEEEDNIRDGKEEFAAPQRDAVDAEGSVEEILEPTESQRSFASLPDEEQDEIHDVTKEKFMASKFPFTKSEPEFGGDFRNRYVENEQILDSDQLILYETVTSERQKEDKYSIQEVLDDTRIHKVDDDDDDEYAGGDDWVHLNKSELTEEEIVQAAALVMVGSTDFVVDEEEYESSKVSAESYQKEPHAGVYHEGVETVVVKLDSDITQHDVDYKGEEDISDEDLVEKPISSVLVHTVQVEHEAGASEIKGSSHHRVLIETQMGSIEIEESDDVVSDINTMTLFSTDEQGEAISTQQKRIVTDLYEFETEPGEGAKEVKVLPITPVSDISDLSPGARFTVDVSSETLEEEADKLLALPDESESVSVSEKAIGSSPEEQENLEDDEENVLDQDDDEFDEEVVDDYGKKDDDEVMKDIDEELDQEIEEQEQLTAALMSQYSKDGEEDEEENEDEERRHKEEADGFGIRVESSSSYVDREESGEEVCDAIKRQIHIVTESSLEKITEQTFESDIVRSQEVHTDTVREEDFDTRYNNEVEVEEEDVDKAFEKYEDEPEVIVPIDAEVGEHAEIVVEDLDIAFEKYEDEPEVIVPIDAEVGEHAEIVVEDLDKAFEKYEHEPELSVAIDAKVDYLFTEEQDISEEASEIPDVSTDVVDLVQKVSVKFEEKDVSVEKVYHSEEGEKFEEQQVEKAKNIEYEVKLNKAIVQETLHTGIETTMVTKSAKRDAEQQHFTGILAEMQALEYQQSQEDVQSEDELDEKYDEENNATVYDEELDNESKLPLEDIETTVQVKKEQAITEESTTMNEINELERSIDRMEEKIEKFDSAVMESCSLEEMNQSVDRTEVRLEQTVDVLDSDFVADRLESTIFRHADFSDSSDVLDKFTSQKGEWFEKEDNEDKDKFIEDVKLEKETLDTNLQEIQEIPESFIDRSERFLELLQDTIRPDDDDKDRLGTYHTDFDMSGDDRPDSSDQTRRDESRSQQASDGYRPSQGAADGLQLSRASVHHSYSQDERLEFSSDLERETSETDLKFSEVKQIRSFDEGSTEEEYLDPEASSQPQEGTGHLRKSQEIAGLTFMASSISGSDYTSQSDVEYAQSETTGTGSYYTAPSEVMSSSSYTAQSETMTESEYTMTGSECGHDADEEEFESEGRLSADISQQIYIEQNIAKKYLDKEDASSSEDEFDDGMDRLDRPPSPSEFTLIESQDTERLNISLGITPQMAVKVTTLDAVQDHFVEETIHQVQKDTLHVQYDTDIEKDSLQDEEEEQDDYDEEDDEQKEGQFIERMTVDLASSDRLPSPSDFTLIASQDQESLQRILNIEEALSPERDAGSPMQWEHDLEKAIIDADAMSTASSDAALMIGLDRMSVTGTDNNTMSGVSSESGQQVDSPKEQFSGESPLDDIEDRQQLYHAYLKEMESDKITEEDLMGKVSVLSESDDFSVEPCEDNFRRDDFDDDKTGEYQQHGETNVYDMYEDYVESQRSLQEKEDSKETLSLEVGYSSPPVHFDMSQEELHDGLVSVTELEERLHLPAQKEDGINKPVDETDDQIEEEGGKYKERVYTSQLEDMTSEELIQQSIISSSTEFSKNQQIRSEWLSEQQEKCSEQASYSYTYDSKQEMISSEEEEAFRQSTIRESVQSSRTEFKASSLSTTESETKSVLGSQLEHGDSILHHNLEAVGKRSEDERHGMAAMALHTVDKVSSSSSEVAQLDDFDDQDVEIREVSEETSEETDVEDQFSPVLAQAAGPAFVFDEVSSLSLSYEKDKKTQESDLTPVDMEGHEEQLLKHQEVSKEQNAHEEMARQQVQSASNISKKVAEQEIQEVDETEVRTHLGTLEAINDDIEHQEMDEELEEIDDTEFEPELCGLSHSDDHEIDEEEEEEEINEQVLDSEDLREKEQQEDNSCMAYDNIAFRDEKVEVYHEKAAPLRKELVKQETRDISPEDLEEKPLTFDFPDDFMDEMAFQVQYDRRYVETISSCDIHHRETGYVVSETMVRDIYQKESIDKEESVDEEEEFRMEPSDDINAQKGAHSLSDLAHVDGIEESEVPAVVDVSGEDDGDDESDEVSSKSSSDSGGVEVFDEQTGLYTRLPWEIAHQYKRQFSESFNEEQKSTVKPQKSIDMGTFYRRDKSKDEEFLEKSFYDDSEPVTTDSVANKRRVTFGVEEEEFVSTIDEDGTDTACEKVDRSLVCEPYERIDETHDADVLVTIMESRQFVRSEIAKQVFDPEFPETPKQTREFNMATNVRQVTSSVFDESEEDAMFSFQNVQEERFNFSRQRSEVISVVSKESRMAQQELLLQESLDEEDRSLSPSHESSSKKLSTTFEEILPDIPPPHPTHFPMAVHSVGKSLADNEIYESSETERDSTEEKLSPIEETPGIDEFEEEDKTLKSTPPVEKKVTFQTDRLTTRVSDQSVEDFKASSSSSELSVEPTLLAASYDLDSGSVCHVVTAYDISPDTVEKQGPIEIAGKSILSSPEDDVFETDALTSHKTSELSPDRPMFPHGHLLSNIDVCPSPPLPIAPVSTPREGSEREDLSSSLQSASTILERLRHDTRMDSKDGEDTTLQDDDLSSPHEEAALVDLKSEEESPEVEFPDDIHFSDMNFSGQAVTNGYGPHTEDVDTFEEQSFSSLVHDVTEISEVRFTNGPTEVDYIPEYDGGDDRPSNLDTQFGGSYEEIEFETDLIDSDITSSMEAKSDTQHPEDDYDIRSIDVEPIHPTVTGISQAKPDIQQPTKDDDGDDDKPGKEKRIKPTFVPSVQAKPDIQQPTKDDDGDDDKPDGEKRIKPTFFTFTQAKPDVQQPDETGSSPEYEGHGVTSSQVKSYMQQRDDEPDGEDVIIPTIMTTSGAKPDIQQADDDKDAIYPVVEVPIQPVVTTSGHLKSEEHPRMSTVSVMESELDYAFTELVEKEDIHSSSVVKDEELNRHMEQEIFIGRYSLEGDEEEDHEDRSFCSKEEVYHGKRALDSLEDTTFSEVYEERDDTIPGVYEERDDTVPEVYEKRDDSVPEGYAMSGEPTVQDEPALQEGDEDLELEEEEEFEERPEEELIRLEEPPAESDDEEEEECVDNTAEKSRGESYSVIPTGLSSTDLLRASTGSQSDLDRPLSPTPDALRQGFFGGNFTPPQSGMFTPPITGSFTPPQASQETNSDDSAGIEKAAVTLVDSVFEDVKVKVSCQTVLSEDVSEVESRKIVHTKTDKMIIIEQTFEEVLSGDDEYGQADMSTETARRKGVTLVKQISEDIPGIILTQHLHEEMNEDEYYGYSPQPESISEDEEDRYLKEMAEMSNLKKEIDEVIPIELLSKERKEEETLTCVVLEASKKPIVEGFVTDEPPSSAPLSESPQTEQSFLGSSDPGSGFVFTESTQLVFHDHSHDLGSADLQSGSDMFDDIIEPMLSPEDHGDSSSVDSFATVVAAEADEDAEYEADENRLAEIASMTSSFTSDIQVSFPEENRRELGEDVVDTEDDDGSMERSQEWLSTTPDDKDRESDTSNDSDKFEFVDRAALSVITEMSDEDKFEMIEGEDLESETGLSDHLGSSPDVNIQQSPGISNLRFFGRGAEKDDNASISSSLAEFEKLEKAIPISSSLSSIERDPDRESFGGSLDERKLIGFPKLKEGEESTSIASSLAEFEHLEQVLVVSSSGSSVEKHTPESKSSGGSGENTSNSISSSLADFERFEHECQADSDDKKSSVESSSRPSEASSCTSLNEFERFEREIAVAAQLEVEAQKIVSILESGVLMESAQFGGEEKDSPDGHDDIDHDSLSEGARLGHDEDADSLDGESSEVTEMASSVVFTGADLAVSQAAAADLDTDSLQGEALMQLSSDSLILEHKLKSSDSAKFDTDSLFGQDDRMVQSGDSLEFGGHSSGGHSSGGQSSGGQSCEKQEDKSIPGEDQMQTSVDSLEMDNSKEEAKESVEKDQHQDDSLMMVSVESAAWSMGSSCGTGHSMSESSHSHDIMQVSTESDIIKTGAVPEKALCHNEQVLASETSASKESREYHLEHQQWHHRTETTVQHVRQHQSPVEIKTKPKRESPKLSEYDDPEKEDSIYLAKGPYQETKKVYTMAEWEAIKKAKKEEQEREATSSALSSSPDLSENSDRDEKQSPPSQLQLEPQTSQKTSMISYSTTTTSYHRGGRDQDQALTSDDDDVCEGAESHGFSDFGDEDVQTHRVVMKKEVHKRTMLGTDGEEETTVREDSQIQQENDPPEELQESMQEIIRQFMESDPHPEHQTEQESLEDDV